MVLGLPACVMEFAPGSLVARMSMFVAIRVARLLTRFLSSLFPSSQLSYISFNALVHSGIRVFILSQYIIGVFSIFARRCPGHNPCPPPRVGLRPRLWRSARRVDSNPNNVEEHSERKELNLESSPLSHCNHRTD